MSDQYGLRRILGSRLRTSSPQNSKWPRKKDIRNLYLFIIIKTPCDTTKQFLTLLQIPLHVKKEKKWKFGLLNLGSVSSRSWVSRCTRSTLQADRGGLS